jgi:NAD+--asparagine ADP-ribosyltransferase
MKVNIYDPENVKKGKMMLLNIAEDLKDDCRITVSPTADKNEEQALRHSKPQTLDEIEQAVVQQKLSQEDFSEVGLDDFDVDKMADQSDNLYMELKSTNTFKDIDIDAMLEHSTFEDLMKGMYLSKIQATKTSKQPVEELSHFDKLMIQF